MIQLYIKLFVCMLLVGCVSPQAMHTKLEQQIQDHTQKMTEDARKFIAVAHDLVKKSAEKSNDTALKQAADIIQQSQFLLDARQSDGEDLKKLTGDKLQEAINKISEQDAKLRQLNEALHAKDRNNISQIVADEIKHQAIADHEFWKSLKLYSIMGTILAIVLTLFVYVPSSASRAALSWVGLMHRSSNDTTQKG